MRVELVYFPGCPHVDAARVQLRRALEVVGAAPSWVEIDLTNAPPPHARGFGSPSILVNGREVTGAEPADGPSCRAYAGSERRGVPPLGVLIDALGAGAGARGGAGNLAVLPGALLSVLPAVSCPSCWPTYAGVLGSLGVPFLMDADWLMPLTALALVGALAGLAWSARRHRRSGPLLMGAIAVVLVFGAKLLPQASLAAPAGSALLVVASLWSERSRMAVRACASCRTA